MSHEQPDYLRSPKQKLGTGNGKTTIADEPNPVESSACAAPPARPDALQIIQNPLPKTWSTEQT